MDFTFPNKIKTFQPLIIFHNNNEVTDVDCQHRSSLIKQHQIKTKEMLQYNAQLWGNKGKAASRSVMDPLMGQHYDISDQQTGLKFEYTDDEYVEYFDNKVLTENEILSNVATEITPDAAKNSAKLKMHPSISLPLYTNKNSKDPLTVLSTTNFTSAKHKRLSVDYNKQYNNTSFILNFDEEDEEEQNPLTLSNTVHHDEPQFRYTYKPYNGKKKRRGNIPKVVTEFLKSWLIVHKEHPYPTELEKQILADETNLSVNQISNWFINARRRILQPLLESENQQQQQQQQQQQSTEECNYNTSIFNPMNQQRPIDDPIDITNQRFTYNRQDNDSNHQNQYSTPHELNYNNMMNNKTPLMYTTDMSLLHHSQDTTDSKYCVPLPWESLPPIHIPKKKKLKYFEFNDNVV
ncbi:uncharacterized protein BX663DRAFT_489349 [Cokeromyces recurvatus]|uniref:uncharacterized protein n=1 Tax=Cokeromyces recurvatus TaxID=90255 RepID=UPI0022208965|nr:uncharacterized protein BX663DRAFT_489349 [Cokeromyces recurvatus]KAI7899227.1 hypothetical protein BX663DRAFT_489349 [Cokeromyces recurvatus]